MRDNGFSLMEMICILALIAFLAVFAVPSLLKLYYQSDLNTNAVALFSEMKSIKYDAIAKNYAIGIIFYAVSGKWYYLEAQDGNQNGIRLQDISDGTDPVIKGPVECSSESQTADVGVIDWSVPRIPPDTGYLDPSNPVQFGDSAIFSCSPSGTCSPGTLYLMSTRLDEMRAIRVFGPTAKFTLWRYSRDRGWVVR